jgi:hypothetical protein
LDLEGLKEQGLHSSTVGLVVVLLQLGLHFETNMIGQYMYVIAKRGCQKLYYLRS